MAEAKSCIDDIAALHIGTVFLHVRTIRSSLPKLGLNWLRIDSQLVCENSVANVVVWIDAMLCSVWFVTCVWVDAIRAEGIYGGMVGMLTTLVGGGHVAGWR